MKRGTASSLIVGSAETAAAPHPVAVPRLGMCPPLRAAGAVAAVAAYTLPPPPSPPRLSRSRPVPPAPRAKFRDFDFEGISSDLCRCLSRAAHSRNFARKLPPRRVSLSVHVAAAAAAPETANNPTPPLSSRSDAISSKWTTTTVNSIRSERDERER